MDTHIGEILKNFRLERGYTIAEVAEKTEVNEKEIEILEAAITESNMDFVLKLLELYDIKLTFQKRKN